MVRLLMSRSWQPSPTSRRQGPYLDPGSAVGTSITPADLPCQRRRSLGDTMDTALALTLVQALGV